MHITRRQFTRTAAGAGAVAAYAPWSFALASALQLGLNTWSLRALPHDTALATIRKVMRAQKLRNCQLLFLHVEPSQFSPAISVAGPNLLAPALMPPTPQQAEQRKAQAAARSEWHLSVPMSYFQEIRAAFAKDGLRITAYATSFNSSAEELDRLCMMTKALGATSMNGRVPEALTDVVAAAATKHRLNVGIQVSDVTLLEKQLRVSPFLRADPDTGDLTKAKIDPLQFVQSHSSHMDCIDLKDAVAGIGSLPFGEGAARLNDVLRVLKQQPQPVTAYIDCDYPGTGQSEEEVERCVSFARKALA